jgi:hypothetical protein
MDVEIFNKERQVCLAENADEETTKDEKDKENAAFR